MLIAYVPMTVGGSLRYYGSDEAEFQEIYRIRGILPLHQTFHAFKASEFGGFDEETLRTRATKFNTLQEFKDYMYLHFGVK